MTWAHGRVSTEATLTHAELEPKKAAAAVVAHGADSDISSSTITTTKQRPRGLTQRGRVCCAWVHVFAACRPTR
jgi:hypothetical protein